MREAVRQLMALGPMPDERSTTDEEVAKYTGLLKAITKPVTDEEARALIGLFGQDDYYGLSFTLVHLIESAPHWPLKDCLANPDNEWVRELRGRAERGGHTFP